MNADKVPYQDRYEHLLLERRKIRDAVLRQNGTTHVGCEDPKKYEKGMASFLANYAAMSGMFMSARIDTQKYRSERSKNPNNYNDGKTDKELEDEEESILAIMEHNRLEQNFDRDIIHNNRNDEMSYGALMGLAALERSKYFELSSPLNEEKYNLNDVKLEEDVYDLADMFFKDYPECRRKDEIDLTEYGNESIKEINSEPFCAKKNERKELETHVCVDDQSVDTYLWEETHKKNEKSSNEVESYGSNIIRVKSIPNTVSSNPFYTAREYSCNPSLVNNPTNDIIDNHKNPNFDHKLLNSTHNLSNPYHRIHKNLKLLVPSSISSRPVLSAGLKRKFQMPKLRGMSCVHNPNSINNSSMCMTVQSQKSSNNNPEIQDLPEELRHLDKDLVQKILSEIIDNGDKVTFDDIAGLSNAKQTVMELICWPMKRPDLFTGLRSGPNGLLLFGPPGTGKTLIGKAISHESEATFFSISSSSLTSKWIGEGEKLVRTLFAVAAYREPAVVFIDEIDSLLTQRKADENDASRRIKTEFLVQLDGTSTSGQGRVLVVGATNRPHELDDAARRRFVKRLYIPLPVLLDREVLLRTLLSKNSHCLTCKEIIKLSSDTEGFSGADLKALCTDAALGPIRQLGTKALEINAEDVPPISYNHFRQALRGMNPSVSQADLDVYVEWNKTYGSKIITAADYIGSPKENLKCIAG